MIVVWIVMLSFQCVETSDTIMNRQIMEDFLERLGHQLSNQPVKNAGALINPLATNMGIDFSAMFQLVNLACEIAQDDGHDLTYDSIYVIKASCGFIEGIAAHYLAVQLIIYISKENTTRILTSTEVRVDGGRFFYPQIQGMFPRVCEKVDANEFINPATNEPVYAESIKTACALLRQFAFDFLNQFSRIDHNSRSRLTSALGPISGFTTLNGRVVTYGQVSMTIPSICVHKSTYESIRSACNFFESKASEILQSISRILENDEISVKSAEIEKYNSNSVFKFHQAKPFIRPHCKEADQKWDIDSPNLWIVAACDYFLKDHMEALLKPPQKGGHKKKDATGAQKAIVISRKRSAQ